MDWAMLQAVGCRFLIAEAWIPSQATSHGILWWTKWHRDGYTRMSEYFESLLSASFHECPIPFSYILVILFIY